MRMFIVLAFALMAAGQVFAADLPLPAIPGSYSVPSVQNWTGYYIGVNGGYGFGTSSWSDPNNPGNTLIGGSTPPGTDTGNFSTSGFLGGATIGLTYQLNSLAFGLESDFDWSGIRGSTSPSNGFCSLPVSATAVGSTCQTKLDWLGTARIRVGYANERLFVYGTGGAAFGSVATAITGTGLPGVPGAPGSSQSNLAAGWTAGAGIEFAFLEGFSAKVEYLFVDLGQVTCNVQISCGIDAASFSGFTPANSSVALTANIIRVGINYKFVPW